MGRYEVKAGEGLLEGYVRNPPTGLCELIWNAFDEDAENVEISIEYSPMQAIDRVLISDDGIGMSMNAAMRGFLNVGDSWKAMPGTTSEVKTRPVHGKYGRGRYTAFSLGLLAKWHSVTEVGGELKGVNVNGTGSDLTHFEIDEARPGFDESGTVVTVSAMTPEAQDAFDAPNALRDRILTEFALHLDRFSDFKIKFKGENIDPAKVQRDKVDLDVPLPEGQSGKAVLTVIEWDLKDVERRLYLCAGDGSIVDEIAPGVQAPGAEFTAYLTWDGFTRGQPLHLLDDTDTPVGQVLEAAKDKLREHLVARFRVRENQIVQEWKDEGVYPYKDAAKTESEKATRQAFHVVAMAASRTVEESRTKDAKTLMLGALRQAFEHEPESLLPILASVTKLSKVRIDELRDILERTTLTNVITASRKVGDRLDFIHGLNALLFDKSTRKATKERRQLHRILARETWIFGEEWTLTGDDQRLTEVLKQHLALLEKGTELAEGGDVLTADGRDLIPDLVLGRRLQTGKNQFDQLVVELKRPNHNLADEDVMQLRKYADAIFEDERFSQHNVTWEFWLVGNDTRGLVDRMRTQSHLAPGVVQEQPYRIVVKKWSEVIGDAEHRLKFVQDSLNYETNRDKGLESLRKKFSEYLPEEASPEAEPEAKTA
jgi:catechol 2,3-dioxygenase-like lactoylglutathione lyase family enzyme